MQYWRSVGGSEECRAAECRSIPSTCMEKYNSIAGQIGGRWRESIIDLRDQSAARLPTQTGRRGTEGVGGEEVAGEGCGVSRCSKKLNGRRKSTSFRNIVFFTFFPWLIWLTFVPCWHDKSGPLSRLTSWPLPSVTLSLPGSALTLTASIKMTRKRQAVASRTIFFFLPGLRQQSNDLC